MARIRRLDIRNFRSIRTMTWMPSPGINCLIGPGDSGKSSILDAIELCLGTRRGVTLGDVDFHRLDVNQPIDIEITLGDLPDELKNIEVYGDFLRGFDDSFGELEDEPRADLETVLTIRFRVESNLEPNWALYSERACNQGIERDIRWKERTPIAPARIGAFAQTHLSWARGSVLNRLTNERADLGSELAEAAREARAQFGDKAAKQLGHTLEVVTANAKSLGVPVGSVVQALLDAHSVSIRDGAISLHSESGIPLRSLGTGSSRLLIAGLQRAAAEAAHIALVDEVEFGLEPHRLIRLLDALGAKDSQPPLQVFMTTHSPVALRELSGAQVFVVRARSENHQIHRAGTSDEVQSTLRADPEAFLAKSIIVCEGASEVGFARGLDQFWSDEGETSFFARGGAYVNVGGGSPDKSLKRGAALQRLGYRVLVFIDADKPPSPAAVAEFQTAGGQVLAWRAERTLEDELFLSLPDTAIEELVKKACELKGSELVSQHISSKSEGKFNLTTFETDSILDGHDESTRKWLGAASRVRNDGWFKSVSAHQEVAKIIVGPHLAVSEIGFQETVEQLRVWMHANRV